ncbi:LOW QUALITY PROTEIN: fibroin light chain-like [Cydia pomonella]|uniref:LOW QUALITY PROTEIN: fibroin light chain-like n=1 Tax=Cydia pomonella TaxID=82600 RepID=UPI002ADD46BF|nr:LOW QUALITY PROTEIN: fibroin light chain-like [Cydia pomonella]
MLSFALVLLVASSAFAAPSVSVSQYGINEIAPVRDNGRLVSSYVTDRSFEIVDGGDTNIYILTVQQILNDLANQNDAASQALAVSQTLAALGELATGIPGDSCEAAAVANAVASGNAGAIRQAVANFVGRLQSSIDLIVQLANNPNSVRYATGPRSNCVGGGRAYQFEAAWDAILNAASPYTLPLVNEEYCAAKRLYSAFNSRSNNVGAAVTAASVPQVVAVVQRALTPVANFLRAVASGANPAQAAAIAKSALVQAASA